MDQLPQLGTEISEIAQPTADIYAKLLQANASAIRSTARQTFQYGPLERHTLDVYTPKTHDGTKPVFIFLHGGGLVAGARILGDEQIPNGLAYANMGHFFAEQYGFTVVIANYRLIKHDAKFPSGGEDISFVIEWLQNSSDKIKSAGKPRDLFVMGHSAGGVHLSTYLFAPAFAEGRKTILGQTENTGLRLRGIVFSATVFSMAGLPASRNEMIKTYWGDEAEKNCPMGLIRSVAQDGGISKALPAIQFLALKGEYDSVDEVVKAYDELPRVWANGRDTASNLQIETLAGHNHISPNFSLGTGIAKEEAWGHMVGVFVNTVRALA